MNFSHCGAPIPSGSKFCTSCGAPLQEQSGSGPIPYTYNPNQARQSFAQRQQPRPRQSFAYGASPSQLPPQYRPLSPWAYFGYSILFAIPVIGFILLIVFSFSDENINRRNYARSFFCALLIGVIVTVVLSLLGVFTLGALMDKLRI